MKKYFLYALMLCAFISCKDNSGLYGLLADMDNRIAEVEQQCEQINTNIDALEALVEAQQTGDYITAIIPIKEGDVEIGYTITFAKHDPITIYHGKNGKDGQDGQNGTNGTNGTNGQDGHSPVIGVAQDTDGVYYWTLDGEWMLDGNGQKLRVTGQDGQDGQDGTNGTNGITPQLKIEADYWYISYDGGTTWTQLGKAKGEDGADGQDGDSMFQSVTQDDLHVYFTLTNGTTIVIVKANSDINDFEQTIKDNLVTTLTLTTPKDTIIVGEEMLLTAETTPFSDSKKNWSVTNSAVATIEDGLVTGVSIGIVTITVTSGDKSVTKKIYVKNNNDKPYFSVSATQKVQFAPTNTLYYASGWKFAETPYYRVSETNDGTTHHNILNSNYATMMNEDLKGWRVLSKDEWTYLLQTRTNAVTKMTYAKVANQRGVILLPDQWTAPSVIQALTIGMNFNSNVYSADEWEVLQLSGAIFLVCPGLALANYYLPYEYSSYDDYGGYFTSYNASASPAYYKLVITNLDLRFRSGSSGTDRAALRFVKDVE